MLVGTTGVDNVMALVCGLASIAIGLGLIRWRSDFLRGAAAAQRIVKVGAPIPRYPWLVIVVGAVSILAGVGLVLLGLLYRFVP